MKPQDLIFIVVFLVVIGLHNSKIAAIIGIALLLLSIPLFYEWVFFTAQRLTYYAAALFLVAIILHLISTRKKKERVRS